MMIYIGDIYRANPALTTDNFLSKVAHCHRNRSVRQFPLFTPDS